MATNTPITSSAGTSPVVVAGVVGGIAALLGLVGVFLDWVSVDTAFGSIGRKGIDTDDGKLALAAVLIGLVAALFATMFRSRGWFLVVGVMGAVALGIAIYDGRDVSHRVANANEEAQGFVQANVGAGLWVLGVAGVLMLLCSLFGFNAARQAKEPAIVEATPLYRECPHCKEQMRRDAAVCPHCRMESPPWHLHDGVWWVQSKDGTWHYLDEATGEWKLSAPLQSSQQPEEPAGTETS
jgi:hypothetical protein